MLKHKIEADSSDKRRDVQGRALLCGAVLSCLSVVLNQDTLPDLLQLIAAGVVTGLVGFVPSKLTRRSARAAAILYFCIGFAIGALAWTFKTSLWTGDSNARRVGHLPLDQVDRAWCILYDHYLALAAGAALLVFLVGELSRGILQVAGRASSLNGPADPFAH